MRNFYLLWFSLQFICLQVSAQTEIEKDSSFLEELKPGDVYTISIRNYACFGGGSTIITVKRNEEGYLLLRRNSSNNKFRRLFKEPAELIYERDCLTNNDIALLRSFEKQIRAKIKDPDKECIPVRYSGMWSEISISLNQKTINYPDMYGNLHFEQLLNYFFKNAQM